MSARVLIVDDEGNMRWVLTEALTAAGYDVTSASSGPEALQQMAKSPVELVILDLKLKGMDGLATLRRLRERWPDVVVIILTAYGTVATAVEAMQLGAADYLRKPFDVEEVAFKLQRALERKGLQDEVRRLRRSAHHPERDALVGRDPAWLRCVEQVGSLTALDLDILFTGEAGVGKTALARLAHASSDRQDAPFVEIDLRTLRPPIQRAVLLGEHGREGARSQAGAGTLLLLHMEQCGQDGWAALREAVTQRRGGGGPRLLLTANSLTLPDDLILSEVRVPPLRERRADIPLLAHAFADGTSLTAGALDVLTRYSWPGNVAELRCTITRAVTLARDGVIDEQHVPEGIQQQGNVAAPITLPPEGLSLEAVEITLLEQALSLAGGNKTRAAELLGLTRHTLLYRLEKYGLGS